MKNIVISRSKKVLALLLAYILIITSMQTCIFEEVNAESSNSDTMLDGKYECSLNLWLGVYNDYFNAPDLKDIGSGQGNTAVPVDIKSKAILIKEEGKFYLEFTLDRVSQYETVQVLKQEFNEGHGPYVIPDNWMNFKGEKLDGLDELKKKGKVDKKENNKYIEGIDRKAEYNEMDRASFKVPIENIDKELVVVACYKEKGKTGDLDFSATNMQIDIDTITKAKISMEPSEINEGALYAETLTNKFTEEDSYDLRKNTYFLAYNLFRDDYESPVNFLFNGIKVEESSYDEDKIDVKLSINDVDKDRIGGELEIEGIYELAGQSISEADLNLTGQDYEHMKKFYFSNYRAGKAGNIYGEKNLYKNGTFNLTFNKNDNSLTLGKSVIIKYKYKYNGKNEWKQYFRETTIALTKKKVENTVLIDKDTGIIFEESSAITRDNLKLIAKESVNDEIIEQAKNKARSENFVCYDIKVENNGKPYDRKYQSYFKFPLPKEWKDEQIYAAAYRLDTNSNKVNLGVLFSSFDQRSNARIIEENGNRYLVVENDTVREMMHSSTIYICLVTDVLPHSEYKDLADGKYKVEGRFLREQGSGDSMATAALEDEIFLEVKEGKKYAYFNLKPIKMGSMEAFCGNIWGKKDYFSTVELDYYTKEDGELEIAADEFNPFTEFACPKSIKVELDDKIFSTSSEDKIEGYMLELAVPFKAASAGIGFREASTTNVFKVKFVLYKIDKKDDLKLPLYQRSALKRAIGKAKMYDKDNYTEASYLKLKTALEGAETYYNEIKEIGKNEDIDTGKEIELKIANIEDACKNIQMKKDGELFKEKEKLKEQIDIGDKLERKDMSFIKFLHVLIQSHYLYEEGILVSDVKAQVKLLKKAIAHQQSIPDKPTDLDASKLKDGEYNVQVFMKHAYEPKASMSDVAVKKPAKIVVKNGEYKLILEMTSVKLLGKEGYLAKLWYNIEKKDGEYNDDNRILASVLEKYEVEDEYNKEGGVFEGQKYPKILEVPIETPENNSVQDIYVEVFVPVMEAIGVGAGTQYAIVQLDWNTVIAKEASEEPENIKTVITKSGKKQIDIEKVNTQKEIQDALAIISDLDKSAYNWPIELKGTVMSGNITETAAEDGQAAEDDQDFDSFIAGIIGWSKTEAGLEGIKQMNFFKDFLVALEGSEKAPEPKVSKSDLEKSIEKAEKINQGSKKEGAFKRLKEAISDAKKIFEKDNATQTEVDDEKDRLDAAIKAFNKSEDKDVEPKKPDNKKPSKASAVSKPSKKLNEKNRNKELPKQVSIENTTPEITTFKVDSVKYRALIDGKEVELEMDVKPFIQNDRIMLPVRYIGYAIGAKVSYDNSTREACFVRNGISVYVNIDTGKIRTTDGKLIEMDSKPIIMEGRMMISISNIGKVFGLTSGDASDGISKDIEWNGTDRTVKVNINK